MKGDIKKEVLCGPEQNINGNFILSLNTEKGHLVKVGLQKWF